MSQDQRAPLSMTEFIIQQCRRFGLLYNERTTILSQVEETQLVQYCLASYRQKVKGDFDASQAETLDKEEKIKNVQICQMKSLILANSKTVLKADKDENSNTTDNDDTTDSRLESNQIGTEEALLCDADEELNDVVALFTLHRKTSNHQTILGCYNRFLQELLKPDSELHFFLKSWNGREVEVLENDENSVASVQMSLFEILKDLNPCIKLHNPDDNRWIVQTEADMDPGLLSVSVANPECAKTPSRMFLHKDLASPLQVSTPKTPITPAHRRERQKVFLHDVFCSYIHLLVNSRSQLALARVFNIPDRGLDHVAFTHVKHEAQAAGLSMYQFLASFIMRIRLGGQGYAPSSDAPLMAYIKGLSALLDFTQKLQTMVEEITDLRCVCNRVVKVIKNNLTQCKSGKFPRSLVESCATDIQSSLAAIIDQKSVTESSPSKTVGCGGSLLGRRCQRILQRFLDQRALQRSTDPSHRLLQDLSFSQTPTRLPCLLSQFRSPCMPEAEEKDLKKKSKECLKQTKQSSCFVSSALYFEEDEPFSMMTQRTLSSIEVLPSKTLVEPKACDAKAGRDLVNSTALHTVTAQANKATDRHKQTRCKGKRKGITLEPENYDSDIIPTDINKAKKISEINEQQRNLCGEGTPKSSRRAAWKQTRKPEKSCRKRLLPQVKGQSKITGFFRI